MIMFFKLSIYLNMYFSYNGILSTRSPEVFIDNLFKQD